MESPTKDMSGNFEFDPASSIGEVDDDVEFESSICNKINEFIGEIDVKSSDPDDSMIEMVESGEGKGSQVAFLDDTEVEEEPEEVEEMDESEEVIAKKRKRVLPTDTSDLKTTSTALAPKRRRLAQPKRLDTVLQGLMGEANIRFARGDIKNAQKLCLEIIRQEPRASQPYRLLATIFEQSNNTAKQLQLLIISAHLNPSNVDLWIEILNLQINMKLSTTEILKTYAKAITAAPNDLQLQIERMQFISNHFQELSDNRDLVLLHARLRFASTICSNLSKRHDSQLVLKNLLGDLMKQTENNMIYLEKSMQTFLTVFEMFQNHPLFVIPKFMNFLLDSLLKTKRFKDFLTVISDKKFFPVDFEYETDSTLKVHSFKASGPISADLETKILSFLICLQSGTKIETNEFLENELNRFLARENVETNGDLFMDLCEVLTKNGFHRKALDFFEKLLKNELFNLPAIWLRYANCLRNSGSNIQAIEMFEKILKNCEPDDFLEVRLILFELYYETNNVEKAIRIIREDFLQKLSKDEIEKFGKLLQKYYESFSNSSNIMEREQFAKIIIYFGEMVLTKHFVSIESNAELRKIFEMGKSRKSLTKKLTSVRDSNEEFNMLKTVLDVCLQCRLYDKMHYFTYLTINSKHFRDCRDELALYAIQGCSLNKDFLGAYILIREVLIFPYRNTKSFVWNLLNHVSSYIESKRRSKFCSRYIRRVLDQDIQSPLRLILAINFLSSRMFRSALFEFLKCPDYYNSDDSLIECQLLNLLLAICFVQLSASTAVDDRPHFRCIGIHHAIRYFQTRKQVVFAEAMYNLARFYHFINDHSIAICYYKEILKISDTESESVADFKSKAAFNLFQIYKAAEDYQRARYLLQTYFEV